ncbi:HNH endonuclease signature motif containing protein [Dietzia alimentaria]|uniref:HNH endonuclease signature motif containing protein n=1 Tax=Dietzia alimentaria TaxID=665550 RepID=UPI00029A894C|nr:HNH endonuclease signature motif containing protein [Dietzia alimentaria]
MLDTTTTSSVLTEPLRGVDEPLGSLDADALSEIARSATLSQNLAGATRLEAAFHLVERIRRLDEALRESDSALRSAFARLAPADQARDHLVAAMSLTNWHAGRLVAAGLQIHTRLRLLRDAVGRGLVPEQLAIDTACRLATVPDQIVGRVESDVVGMLCRALNGGSRPSRTALDSAVDQSVERHDQNAANDAVDEARAQRSVRFRPAANGMMNMWAHLPVEDAERLRRRIDNAARAAGESGHGRPRSQLRADALCSLGDPTTDDVGDPISVESNGNGSVGTRWASDSPIHISVIDGRVQGLPNRVEFVRGAYSSFDWLCEQLLNGGDTTVRFELIDPQPGVLDTPDAALSYRIPAALAERIRLRDGTCRHPGCAVDARDCDLDHILAFDHLNPALGGPTVEWNLACLCRRHHREKTFGHSAYRPGPLGELIITTDTGHEHRTTPTGPLARSREQILDHQWDLHIGRLIAEDGHITNPPGAHRARQGPPPDDRERPRGV